MRGIDDEEIDKSEDRTYMTKVEILGENRFETYTKTRDASRAVIVRDGMILSLIHI